MPAVEIAPWVRFVVVLAVVVGCGQGASDERDSGARGDAIDATSSADAAEGTKRLELLAADRASGDLFGSSIAVGRDVVLVGARHERTGGNDAGAAYVFSIVDGVAIEVQKLTAANPVAGSNFGASLAISDDTIVVGAPSHPTTASFAGAVYVFARVGGAWIEEHKLVASDGAQLDRFGVSVAIDGDLIVVGANSTDNDGPLGFDAGSVYVFRRQAASWVEVQKLVSGSQRSNASFGRNLALAAGRLAVGVPAERDPLDSGNLGVVTLFAEENGVWSETERLVDSERDVGFGASVSLTSELLAVSAPEANAGAGAVRLYELSSGPTRLVDSLTAPGARGFGLGVVTDGSSLVAFGDEVGEALPLAAWRFDFDGDRWIAQEPARPDENGGSMFAASLGIGPLGIVIGVPSHAHDDPVLRHGAAYCE